ncbi:MAG: proprotein convertase P-domain-containing protein [Geminicoccaceae bacterium]|nr:proprotein convertase P-domain-containing protein [Geminicoccaceae bacterium]
MRRQFDNGHPVAIDPGPANTIRSTIAVGGIGNPSASDVVVQLDIDHTWTNDLVIRLTSPAGTSVVLVEREGGSRDDFRNTIFRADAATPIAGASAPFRGTFRPEGDLAALDGGPAEGDWVLEVDDRAPRDGGALNRWSLSFEDGATASPFRIDVRFLGGLSPVQQAAFATAAARWSEIIVGDLPPVNVDGEIVDDVLIEAQGVQIDGPSGILGQAGPTRLRFGSALPAKGIMSFDTADLAQLEADGSLEDVILHETAHVLGFGTLWTRMGLLDGAGSVDPRFLGADAMAEYATLTSRPEPTGVPVANTGGPGTRDGHWREAVFGNELLTGFLSGAVRPISAMSIAAFRDMGYVVDMNAADAYALPTALALAEMGVGGDGRRCDFCRMMPTEPVMLPPSATLSD